MKLPHGLRPRPSVVPIRSAAVGASGLHLAEAAAEAKATPPAAPAPTVGTLIYAIGTLNYTFANLGSVPVTGVGTLFNWY